MFIKSVLQKYVASKFYPTRQFNWYKSKNYVGSDDASIFQDFLKKQTQQNAVLYTDFKDLVISREFVKNQNVMLDSVLIVPINNKTENYIIMFQGRGEYYESKFRDMARLATATGSSVLGFNPRGFNSSYGGSVCSIQDLVNDGVAIVRFLLSKGVKSHNIIMFGNSLGASIQYQVIKYFSNIGIKNFREINSNSFRSLSAVVVCRIKLTDFLKKQIEKILFNIMFWLDWEVKPDNVFYTTGKHRMCLRRYGDKTILPEAEFFSAINPELDNKNCNIEYQDIHRFLNDNNLLVAEDILSCYDPHNAHLYHFKSRVTGSLTYSAFALIDIYIKHTNFLQSENYPKDNFNQE